MSDNKRPATFAVIGKVRFSYAHVFEPHAMEEGQEKKYSVCLIVRKKDKELIAKIEKAVEAAKKAGVERFGSKWDKKLKLPLRDGDVDHDDDKTFENAFFLNATSTSKPGVVDSSRSEILDEEEFYSGCYGYASINFFPFSSNGNNGVAAGLNNVMKTAEGEKLSGRTSANEDFADIEDEDI